VTLCILPRLGECRTRRNRGNPRYPVGDHPRDTRRGTGLSYRERMTALRLDREAPDTSVVPWVSTGWTNNQNVTGMLELLLARREIAIA
jgi:hypothetical protein